MSPAAISISDCISKAGIVAARGGKEVRVIHLRVTSLACVIHEEAAPGASAIRPRLTTLHLAVIAALGRGASSVGHDQEIGTDTGPIVGEVRGVVGFAAVAEVGTKDVIGTACIPHRWPGQDARGGSAGGCSVNLRVDHSCLDSRSRWLQRGDCYVRRNDCAC